MTRTDTLTATATDAADEYRAVVAPSPDRQGAVVLTGPEHSRWSDEAMLAEAMAEAERAGIKVDPEDLVITEWID